MVIDEDGHVLYDGGGFKGAQEVFVEVVACRLISCGFLLLFLATYAPFPPFSQKLFGPHIILLNHLFHIFFK
jgi:hypothetical protein